MKFFLLKVTVIFVVVVVVSVRLVGKQLKILVLKQTNYILKIQEDEEKQIYVY